MFIAEYGSARWGDLNHNSIIVKIKQENDADYFECQIADNDPSPDLASIYVDVVTGECGPIDDYVPVPELLPQTVVSAPSIHTGSIAPVVAGAIVIDLWRVRTALRAISPTPEFVAMVAENNLSLVDADGAIVAPENISGLDQINFMIKVSEDPKLKDFWTFGNYVYDTSPNFAAFASILNLNEQQLSDLKNYAINIVI